MKFKQFTIVFVGLSIIGCNNSPVSEHEMEHLTNKTIHLEMFERVQFKEESIPFDEFRRNFRHIYIVFLEDRCAPCYPKFIEWHTKLEKLTPIEDFTVLFIINARHYENFVIEAKKYGEFNERFYHVMDPENDFLRRNIDIPRKFIDLSLLIDSANRIKLIGAPYATEDMTKVFHLITGVKQ